MEENNVKIFWKPIDGEEFKELEHIGKVEGLDFEPLEEPIDVKYDPTPVTMSFDMKMTPNQFKSIRKLFKNRLPRKFKKRYKNMAAKRFGIKPSKLRFRYNGVFTHK
jgi:hypothetical protein